MDSEEFLDGARDEIQTQMMEDWTQWKKENPIEIVEEKSDILEHYPVIYVTIQGDEHIDDILSDRSHLTQTQDGIQYECRMQQDIVWWDE